MISKFVIDPVCQMEIEPGQAVAVARFEGHRVYFCCENCQAEFLDLPHRYVGWDDVGNHRGGRRRRLDLRRLHAGGATQR